jgi:hypothetical protein
MVRWLSVSGAVLRGLPFSLAFFPYQSAKCFSSSFHFFGQSQEPNPPVWNVSDSFKVPQIIVGRWELCPRRRQHSRDLPPFDVVTPPRLVFLSATTTFTHHQHTHTTTPTQDVGPPLLLRRCHVCRQAHFFGCHCFRPCPTGCLRRCRHLQPQCLDQGKAHTVKSTAKRCDRPCARNRLESGEFGCNLR